MIVRSSKFLLLIVAATLLGSALFVVAAVWQLSRGPISLGFLTPYVAESLSTEADGAQVRLHDTVLTWAGFERTIDLRAVGLEIIDRDGTVAASVPELSVQLSARALMRGLIAPTGLELFGPRLRVVRAPDGEISVGIGGVAPNGSTGPGSSEFLARLLREPDRDSPTGYLRRVAVVSALIEFEDRQSGRSWTAQRADIAMERDDDGIRASGTIALDAGGDFARFGVSGVFNPTSGSVDLGIVFDRLKPAVVASLDPRLSPLDRLDLPISGTLALSLTESLAVEGINFDLVGGVGAISAPELYPAPMPVAGVALRGHATKKLDSVVIDAASIDLGGPVAALTGTVARRDALLDIDVEIRADTVPIDGLETWWPASTGANARAWITRNIKDGQVRTATFSLAATVDTNNLDSVEIRAATGELDIHDATVHYLRPMTPVRNVAGVGRFDGVDLVIDISSGTVGNLSVQPARVAINGLTGPTPVEITEIEATVSGPVREALALLDEKPHNFISPLGFDPQRTNGNQTAELRFVFPLLNALTMEQISVAASAQLVDFSAPAIAFGADLSNGDFTLTVDTKQLIAQGQGVLAGIPVGLVWTEDFTAVNPLRTRYEVKAVVDDGGRTTLGLETAPILTGPVGVGLTYEVSTDGATKGAAMLNLTDATMTLADVDWHKAAGQPGTASIEFAGRDSAIREISHFAVTAPELAAEGRVVLATRQDRLAVSELNFSRLVVGQSDVSVRVTIADDGVPDIALGGNHLDARPLVENALADASDARTSALRLRIDADNPVRAIQLGDETVLQNPSGRFVHDGENWSDVDLQGTLSNAGQIGLRLQTVNGTREFLLESDDGGGVLRALDWITTIEGGRLRVAGAFTGTDAAEKFAGQVSIEEFKLNNSPVMARILSLASFSGIADVLAGRGISFRRAEVPFELTDAEILIGDAKARGADIGILASGRIDRASDTIELNGEIAPAYTLNSIFSNIPIVGGIISGGGDAVFAATYTVTGPLSEPAVSVNPLSILAPGILRRLVAGFGKGEGFQEGSTQPPSAPPPGQ